MTRNLPKTVSGHPSAISPAYKRERGRLEGERDRGRKFDGQWNRVRRIVERERKEREDQADEPRGNM